MVQKKVVSGRKGIVGSNRSLCTAVVIEIKETQCETDWMGSTTLGVSKQSDTLPKQAPYGTRCTIWYPQTQPL